MRITRCQIEGFGHFSDLDLPFGPGLTVVYGPNEAGKTTLLEFVAYVLFGVRRGRSQNRYEPLRGGRHGGRLFLDAEDGEWVIERFAGSDPFIRRAGSADVRLTEIAEELGGADRDLFRTVFAFSLAELQSLQDLATDRVREKLFSAGIAGAGRSVQSAVGDLDGRATEIWRTRADCRLKKVRDALDGFGQSLREATLRAKSYPQLEKGLDEQRSRLAEIRSELRQASRQRERLRTLVMSWPAWSRASEAAAELAELAQCPQVDRDTRNTVERLHTRLTDALEAVAEAQGDVEAREHSLGSLETSPVLLEAGEKIRRLLEEAARIAELDAELESASLGLEEERQAVQRAARVLGLDPESDAVRNLAISDETLASLRGAATELDRWAVDLTHSTRKLQEEAADLEGRLDTERRAVAATTPDQRLLARADAIRQAVIEARAWEAAVRDAEQSGDEAVAAGTERDRRLRQLGLEPARLPSVYLDHETQQRLRSAASAAVERRREMDEERRRLADRERELQDLVPAAAIPAGRETLAARRDAVAACRAGLQDLDRLTRLSGPPAVGFPPPVLAAIAVLSVASVAAATALWSRLGALWGLGSLGVGLLAVGLLVFWLLSPRARSPASLATAGSDAAAIRRRLGLAAKTLGIPEAPTSEAVERAASQLEIDLRALERAEEAARTRRHFEERRAEKEQEIMAATERTEAALAEWRRSLESSGLAPGIAPEQAERVLAALADAQKDEERRQDALRRAEEARRKAEALEQALLELAVSVGREPEGPPGIIAEDLAKRLEETEAAATERRRRTAHLLELESELKRLQERGKDLESDQGKFAERYEHWRNIVACSGPTIAFRPGRALLSIATLGDLARAAATRRKTELKVAQATGRVEDFSSAVASLAEDLSEPVPSGRAACIEAVRALKTKLDEAERSAERAKALTGELEQAKEKLAHKSTSALRIEEELKQALTATGAPDVPTLRRWAELTSRRAELVRQQKEARQDLSEISGSLAGDKSFHGDLVTGRRNEWQADLPELEASIERLQAAETAAVREEMRREAELARIRGDVTIAGLTQEIAAAEERERELQFELLVLQIAQALLTESLDQFRRERQPAVLQHASDLFRSITGGQYVRVEGNPVESSLSVLDSRENVKPAELLSTGTAEQLYLCLRLGLARDYSSRTVPLPFLMDDVLVNFDPERAERVAEVLLDTARESQIVLLTCRPETVEVVQSGGRDQVQVIEMPRFGGAVAPAAAMVRTVSRSTHGTATSSPEHLEREELVLECLRASEELLGKSDILEATGLPDSIWTSTITSLKEKGLVEQEGERRGAGYRAVNP